MFITENYLIIKLTDKEGQWKLTKITENIIIIKYYFNLYIEFIINFKEIRNDKQLESYWKIEDFKVEENFINKIKATDW